MSAIGEHAAVRRLQSAVEQGRKPARHGGTGHARGNHAQVGRGKGYGALRDEAQTHEDIHDACLPLLRREAGAEQQRGHGRREAGGTMPPSITEAMSGEATASPVTSTSEAVAKT